MQSPEEFTRTGSFFYEREKYEGRLELQICKRKIQRITKQKTRKLKRARTRVYARDVFKRDVYVGERLMGIDEDEIRELLETELDEQEREYLLWLLNGDGFYSSAEMTSAYY